MLLQHEMSGAAVIHLEPGMKDLFLIFENALYRQTISNFNVKDLVFGCDHLSRTLKTFINFFVRHSA